jgi:hypothetical protein
MLCAETGLAISVSGNVSGTWKPSDNPFVTMADCHVPAGATLTILPGVRFLLSPGTSMVVDGTLAVAGTATSPVLIGPADAASRPWRNILVTGGGHASFANSLQISLTACEVSGSASSGVLVNGGSLTVARTLFCGNGGSQPIDAAIHVVSGSVSLGTGSDANSILDGVFAVYNEDVVPVNASGQWWGSSSGPQSPENIPGTGASVSDDVVFDSWVAVAPNPAPGDVDRDGAITISDVAALLRIAGGMSASNATTASLGDVVKDGKLNILDAVRLARVAAGLEAMQG